MGAHGRMAMRCNSLRTAFEPGAIFVDPPRRRCCDHPMSGAVFLRTSRSRVIATLIETRCSTTFQHMSANYAVAPVRRLELPIVNFPQRCNTTPSGGVQVKDISQAEKGSLHEQAEQ